MLSAHHDGVYPTWLVVLTIFDSHLALGIGAQIGSHLAVGTHIGHHPTLPADVSQHAQDAVREVERQRHAVFRLVGGIAKHHALVASTLFLWVFALHTAVDVATLLMNGIEHSTALSVELIGRLRVANAVDSVASYLLDINVCIALHLACHYHLARRNERLARHLRLRVVCQQIVQYCVANLVSDLVGMSLRN